MALVICLYKDVVTGYRSCWPSTHPERSSGWRSVNEALCALGKTDRTNLSIDVQKTLWNQFLHLISRKILRSSTVTSAPFEEQQASVEMCVCTYHHFTQIVVYTDLSATSSVQFLRAIWDAVSQATVLILPPSKASLMTFMLFILSSVNTSHLFF